MNTVICDKITRKPEEGSIWRGGDTLYMLAKVAATKQGAHFCAINLENGNRLNEPDVLEEATEGLELVSAGPVEITIDVP